MYRCLSLPALATQTRGLWSQPPNSIIKNGMGAIETRKVMIAESTVWRCGIPFCQSSTSVPSLSTVKGRVCERDDINVFWYLNTPCGLVYYQISTNAIRSFGLFFFSLASCMKLVRNHSCHGEYSWPLGSCVVND